MVRGKTVVATALIIGGLYLLVKKAAAGGEEIELQSGWNQLTYRGPSRTMEDLFASIWDYLEIVYRWDPVVEWIHVTSGMYIPDNTLLLIRVSQDCLWQY